MEARRTVLVVEDDADIADLIEIHIRDAGFDVQLEADGPSGLRQAESGRYGLVVLDLMLPGLDGFEVCKRIRKSDPHLPILMLTSRSEEMDKVLGLELGADDYLTKPFGVRELVARVKALMRRVDLAEPDPGAPLLSFGRLQIDLVKRGVTLEGSPLELTAKEWDLLTLFAKHPGRVFTREELLDLVWGYQYDGYSHTVNTHINRLRNKVERDPARPVYIITKRGLGYRFSGEEA